MNQTYPKIGSRIINPFLGIERKGKVKRKTPFFLKWSGPVEGRLQFRWSSNFTGCTKKERVIPFLSVK